MSYFGWYFGPPLAEDDEEVDEGSTPIWASATTEVTIVPRVVHATAAIDRLPQMFRGD